ncbi:MAG: 37S ribosomal protein, mitochondrial, partial [Phylliscum demangeonii]
IVSSMCAQGGLVLFVGTRPGQQHAVVQAAQLAGACHLFDEWVPGSITNGQQILGHCRLKLVDDQDRDVPTTTVLRASLVDQPALRPDLVVCLNMLENYPVA